MVLIGETLSRLSRVSSVIGKASGQLRNLRATKFIERDSTGRGVSAELEECFKQMVRSRFSKATQSICELVGISIALRRKRFLYERRSKQALATAPIEPRLSHLATQEVKLPHPYAPNSDPDCLKPFGNEVTAEDQLWKYVYIITDSMKWKLTFERDYLKNDLNPLVCLFEECRGAGGYFDATNDWLYHMQWRHILEWHCTLSRPSTECEMVFQTKEELEDHMNDDHAGTFTKAQGPLLAKRWVTPAPG